MTTRNKTNLFGIASHLLLAAFVLTSCRTTPSPTPTPTPRPSTSASPSPSPTSSSTPGPSPTIVRSFDGDIGTFSSPGVPTYRNHPDAGVASSGTQVVTVTGQDFMVFNYAGAVLQSKP